MADAANTNSNVEVFLDEVRSKMSGAFDYTPADTSEKWIYAELAVNNVASADFLSVTAGDTSAYPTYMGTADVVHANDQVIWIAIKNTSTTATDGLLISLDGGTCQYDVVDNLLISANEIFVMKCPLVTVANLHGRTVTVSNGKASTSAQGSVTLTAIVAAILHDV